MSNAKIIPQRVPDINCHEFNAWLATQGRIVTSDGLVMYAVERRRHPHLRIVKTEERAPA